MDSHKLAKIYLAAHNTMRNLDGLQPQESFDELLKFLLYKESVDERPQLSLASVPRKTDLNGQYALPYADPTAIRSAFKLIVKEAAPAVRQVWKSGVFHLSDKCLSAVAQLFAGIDLRKCDLDIRSAALKEFLPSEVRKGLGIYLTPDEVVRAAVEVAAPPVGARVLDPACGSGTFLLEVLRLWTAASRGRRKYRISGVDKNPRMMVLADLNLGHADGVEFEGHVLDSLFDLPSSKLGIEYDSFDFIFTNPPFGVYLDASTGELDKFVTCGIQTGKPIARQQSEITFVEQCLRLLRPGGCLAIVLPRSIATNATDRIARARNYLGTQAYVEGIISLPPETFHATGTQTNTIVLFIRKYLQSDSASSTHRIWLSEVTNCGYDSTGRRREGGQLPAVPQSVRSLINSDKSTGMCRWLGEVAGRESFSRLPEMLAGDEAETVDGVPLGTLTLQIMTGRTPARSAYTDSGLFLVKVGNLTGRGIDWSARDRNFIGGAELPKRAAAGLSLMPGDILMTSSAHSPIYIGKKVDVITRVPEWLGGRASLVGEVMLLRADPEKIDPFALLAFLRNPQTTAQIQRLVRGQTAHLHPKDVASLTVPRWFLRESDGLRSITELLREESHLAERSSELSRRVDQGLECLVERYGEEMLVRRAG